MVAWSNKLEFLPPAGIPKKSVHVLHKYRFCYTGAGTTRAGDRLILLEI